MEHEGDFDSEYSSDASSHPYFEPSPHRRRKQSSSVADEAQVRQSDETNCPSTGRASIEEGRSSMPSVSSTQFQEMFMKAFFQSTASLIGSSSLVLQHAGKSPIGMPAVSTQDPGPASIWSEAAYLKAEARRKKKPIMMRTSAGEESDSQEGFPLPKDATSEQRALRTRRLNRWRAKKARELTSNRKAVKKLPYVIHVDGTGKPRGIHKHKWKAAVRGQCGRLDPTMDNINHHPKNVVDSMWHALEKEWEFEGFAHKAREMFERSATKYMRNKKMQLKYKCLKNVDGPKPDDVSKTNWTKIVDLTKKSMKEEAAGNSTGSVEGRGRSCSKVVMHKKPLQLQFHNGVNANDNSGREMKPLLEKRQDGPLSLTTTQGSEEDSFKTKREYCPRAGEAEASDEDVDAQIKNLRSQLLWLENLKKPQRDALQDSSEVAVQVTHGKGSVTEDCILLEGMKENVSTPVDSTENDSQMFFRSTDKPTGLKVEEDPVKGIRKRTLPTGKEKGGSKLVGEQVAEAHRSEMECGDLISVTALVGGKKEEVGKGVLMGFAGSKLARKVIPKGWCSIKVNTCTAFGSSQDCPFPSGWKDHLKQKTVREAEGRIILWPDSLIHI